MATSQQLAAFNYAVPGPLVWNPVKKTNFTAVAGNAYLVNTTSSAVTVTLPANPNIGQVVQIVDYAGTFATNACTVAGNGSNINALAQNSILNSSQSRPATWRQACGTFRALIAPSSIDGWARSPRRFPPPSWSPPSPSSPSSRSRSWQPFSRSAQASASRLI